MPITENVLRKYINPCFIETGSYKGSTIQKAIDIGFEKIISIELSPVLYKICLESFKNNKNVTLYCGDVQLLLEKILKDIDLKITFWLDAHYSGPGTAKGLKNDPIIEELDIIKKHHLKDHTILVDDMRLMDKNSIINKIKEINNSYKFSFENGEIDNDILVAKI